MMAQQMTPAHSRPPSTMNMMVNSSRVLRTEPYAELAPPPVPHTAEDPLGAGNGIGSMLRVQQKETAAMENEILRLKMIIYTQKKELERAKKPRRLSGKDGYYDFEDEQGSRRLSRQSDAGEPMLSDAVARLDNEVERLNQELTEKSRETQDARKRLDDMRAEAVRARTHVAEVEKRLDQSLSEKMMLRADVEVLRSSTQHEQDRANNLEARQRTMETELRGSANSAHLAEQLSKEKKRVEEADKRVQRMREAVAIVQIDLTSTELKLKSLQERSKFTISNLRIELEDERKSHMDVCTQLNVALVELAAERERTELQKKALLHKCDSHAGRGKCPDDFRIPPIVELEKLIESVNVRHDYVDLSHDNLSKWRDTVLKEINGSLRMLYCFQRQIEEQRNSFVQEYARRVSIESLTETVQEEQSRVTDENFVAEKISSKQATVNQETRAFTGRDTTTNRMNSRTVKRTVPEAA